MVDLMSTFEYLKSLISWNTAFSQRFVEWLQLELAALLKQENLLRIYKTTIYYILEGGVSHPSYLSLGNQKFNMYTVQSDQTKHQCFIIDFWLSIQLLDVRLGMNASYVSLESGIAK